MTELIFNIKNIFDSSTADGCLSQYESTCYHIPAYQRGYKWGTGTGGAVTVLLTDLWAAYEAFQRLEKREYYLQYITVKKIRADIKGSSSYCLEVIDGQQRLTTLSIILSALAAILDKGNISTDKLHYAIRENFFTAHLYSKEALEALVEQGWDDLSSDPAYNKQDIHYLHGAACEIYQFFTDKKRKLEEGDFYDFLLHHVMLIVNSVEDHVTSETVFRNLNSNKIPLTDVELTKAWLITKAGRGDTRKAKRNFNEVMELRTNMGRHWDEISRWANAPELKTFFFQGKEGMHELLQLSAISLANSSHKYRSDWPEKDLPLFNFFHEYPDVTRAYTAIKDLQASLNDWHVDPTIYNLLGFCRFAKDSGHNNLTFLHQCLLTSDRDDLIKMLGAAKVKLMPVKNISALRYGDDNKEIHAVLLHLNVFMTGRKTRFDFHKFIADSWSLEHIFPQSPEGNKKVLNDDEKKAILDMLGTGATEAVKEVLDLPVRDDEQKGIYYKALQHVGLLNSIGNMCLLTDKDNSSNGCMFFAEKRGNILERIRKGSFVPRHTFDVFSKMMEGLQDSDVKIWSQQDMSRHLDFVTAVIPVKTPEHESREV